VASHPLDNTTRTHNIKCFLFSLSYNLHNRDKIKYFVALHSMILCQCVGVDIVDGKYPGLCIGVLQEHASIQTIVQYHTVSSEHEACQTHTNYSYYPLMSD
jgi:hypothetical protein